MSIGYTSRGRRYAVPRAKKIKLEFRLQQSVTARWSAKTEGGFSVAAGARGTVVETTDSGRYKVLWERPIGQLGWYSADQLEAASGDKYGRDERQRYCKDCGCRVDDKGRGYHERGCRRRKDVLTGRPWGVYPHAEWAGDHVETTGRGYVAREVSGAVPYGRMHPLRVFARRQDAEKMAERLSFGPGRAFSRDARRARARRHGRRRLPALG